MSRKWSTHIEVLESRVLLHGGAPYTVGTIVPWLHVPVASPAAPSAGEVRFGVTGLRLVDAATEANLGSLADGQTIDVAGGRQYAIVADIVGETRSVVFKVNGLRHHTDDAAPFAVSGDAGVKDVLPWEAAPGRHVLDVQGFQLPGGGGGTAGLRVRLNVNVVNGPAVQPLRVMPLGDSITEGTDGGYRTHLYALLADAFPDRRIDFVGANAHAGSPNLPDPNHQGHGGYGIDDITANLDGDNGRSGNKGGYWLTGTASRGPVVPDIILLHIGTNDIPYLSAGEMGERLDALVDKLTTLRPTARLLVSNLVPREDSREPRSSVYNALVPGVVAKYAGLGRNVGFVDVHSRFAAGDLRDSLHPSPSGDQKIADAWAEAIRAGGTTAD